MAVMCSEHDSLKIQINNYNNQSVHLDKEIHQYKSEILNMKHDILSKNKECDLNKNKNFSEVLKLKDIIVNNTDTV